MLYDDIGQVVFPVGRIIDGNNIKLLGTCFLVNKIGLLATSAHVVDNRDDNLVVCLNVIKNINSYQNTSVRNVVTISAKIVAINPIYDVCILKIESDLTAYLNLAPSDCVHVGESVYAFGYPHCDKNRMILTHYHTIVGAKIIIESSSISVKNIVLNMQAISGQSGSPIFREDGKTVVAMLIGSYVPSLGGSISLGGIDPQSLHQTTHAVSAEYIMEML